MTVARQLTSSATTVAGAGVRTGLSVATHLTMGARRLVRPDATAPPPSRRLSRRLSRRPSPTL